MRKVGRAAPWALVFVQAHALAAGVSPYLALNLEPEIGSQIGDAPSRYDNTGADLSFNQQFVTNRHPSPVPFFFREGAVCRLR
jgi:hypothetical protein